MSSSNKSYHTSSTYDAPPPYSKYTINYIPPKSPKYHGPIINSQTQKYIKVQKKIFLSTISNIYTNYIILYMIIHTQNLLLQ